MQYAFDLVGVAPMVDFFHHEQALVQDRDSESRSLIWPAYLGVTGCDLDLFLDSMDDAIRARGWDIDEASQSVIQYWIDNADAIRHWRDRFEQAGEHSLVVGRVADCMALQTEFEAMLGKRFER